MLGPLPANFGLALVGVLNFSDARSVGWHARKLSNATARLPACEPPLRRRATPPGACTPCLAQARALSGMFQPSVPHYDTGGFTSHRKFLTDKEYGDALDCLVKIQLWL